MHVADILQPRVIGVGTVRDRRGDHIGVGRAGEEQELLALMAADVAQDAPITLPLEEPGRTLVVADGRGVSASVVGVARGVARIPLRTRGGPVAADALGQLPPRAVPVSLARAQV